MNLQDHQDRMQSALDHFKQQLQKIRTGRAHPGLVEHVQVDYYGTPTPLSQVCSISIEGSRTLLLSPWEKSMIPAIEKAVMQSDLGLNPVTQSDVIRLPMPPLNEERRRELIKVAKTEAESARVAIRNVRRDAMSDLKTAVKEKTLTEDDERREQQGVQKEVDACIAKIDEWLAHKEQELIQI